MPRFRDSGATAELRFFLPHLPFSAAVSCKGLSLANRDDQGESSLVYSMAQGVTLDDSVQALRFRGGIMRTISQSFLSPFTVEMSCRSVWGDDGFCPAISSLSLAVFPKTQFTITPAEISCSRQKLPIALPPARQVFGACTSLRRMHPACEIFFRKNSADFINFYFRWHRQCI